MLFKKTLLKFRKFYFPAGIIFFLEILSANLVLCQSRLGEPLRKNTIVTHTSLRGYLYMGIDNYLSLDSNKLSTKDRYYLESNNGTVIPDSNYQYLTIPVRTGKARIEVFLMNGIDTELAGYQYFTVKIVPHPKMTINDIPIDTPTELPRIALMHCDSLGVFISDDIPGSEGWYKITEFTFGYDYGGFYISHKNPTNILTTETKDIISVTGPDREITIWPKIEGEGRVRIELPIYRITLY